VAKAILNGLGDEFFKLVQGFFELADALIDVLFLTNGGADSRHQFVAVDRLGQKIIRTDLEAFDAIFHLAQRPWRHQR